MKTDYSLINEQLKNLSEGVNNFTSILANASALLFQELEDISWAGFYLDSGNNLVLGPFQGRVACTKIDYGKGVCGTAFKNETTLIVDDVHKFEGHIACDSRSNSEIVIPIFKNKRVIGVLDIDSTSFSRFSEFDKEGLEAFCRILGEAAK